MQNKACKAGSLARVCKASYLKLKFGNLYKTEKFYLYNRRKWKVEMKAGSIKELNIFLEIKNIKCTIGLMGGRTFSCGKTTFKLKDLVRRTEQLAAKKFENSNDLSELLLKIRDIDEIGNRELSCSSYVRQIFTEICRFFGNRGFNKNSHLEALEKNLPAQEFKKPDWVQKLSEGVGKQEYQMRGPFSMSFMLRTAGKIESQYECLQPKHSGLELMRKNYSGYGFSHKSFSMQGLAIVASYIKQKRNLENLFVCDSLEAFQSEIKKIAESTENFRGAFLLPGRGMGMRSGTLPESQHKSTVCVEKIDGKLKICLLDSEPTKKLDFTIIQESATSLAELPYADSDHAFLWVLYHSGIDMKMTDLYRYTTKREYGAFGCETFSLTDAVAFLETPDFFDTLKVEQKEGPVSNVSFLPSKFMKGVQSMTVLEDYMKKNENEARESIGNRKRSKETLPDLIKRNTLKGYKNCFRLIDQNHYISRHSLKYHLLALKAMDLFSTKKLQEIIGQTFIQVDRPTLKGKEPRTLYDLFQNFWSK